MELQPFRFLDLPLELQRLVLAKVYDEPPTITIQARPNSKHPAPLHYVSTLLVAPLLVSSAFHHEAKLAMTESKGVTLNVGTWCRLPPKSPLDDNIYAIQAPYYGGILLRTLVRRYQNLKKIELQGGPISPTAVVDFVTHAEPLSVLNGRLDGDIANEAKKTSIFSRITPVELRDVTISCWIELDVTGEWWTPPRDHDNVWVRLYIYFEMNNCGCRVVGKSLEALEQTPLQEYTQYEVAIDRAVSRLEALSSQK
ncbi:hypothetical protein LTR70_008819 [Exophiala xenobiotica]|uniref:Uncharacterized protein n=1 Tax=Lithohypha guttulata TaxID=1690604 RepID=A0ABR0JZV0_9EURO|nr:hypothetical protein LTR24_008971 [Lithohypha guttulata]KAK5311397.1 hypothetical protein LTR70_008819 [Exophiala xenobiotica]